METYCKHHKIDVDDESFLLDNENTNVACIRCRKLSTFCGNGTMSINSVESAWNTEIKVHLPGENEETFDSPEDSPLLLDVSLNRFFLLSVNIYYKF